MRKVALITGINGQDGSYLAEFLLEKEYEVHGLIRRTSQFNRGRIEITIREALEKGRKIQLHYGNMADSSSLFRIISQTRPAEIYNLAGQSHVGISFDEPEYATDINANGVLRLLESLRQTRTDCRFYQASTSELFGRAKEMPQNENTPFYPRSPYAVAKLYGFWIVKNYREAYDFHASNGILFNHESPRRGENFVTRKITYSLARIKVGLQPVLCLGNLNARRDWGFAKDYVRAMWLMLQRDKADDYIVATGQTHTVREFTEKAARIAGFDIAWEGQGIEERGLDRKSGATVIAIDPKFYRPAEVDITCGDATKARTLLGWQPEVDFDTLVQIMMESDLDLIASTK